MCRQGSIDDDEGRGDDHHGDHDHGQDIRNENKVIRTDMAQAAATTTTSGVETTSPCGHGRPQNLMSTASWYSRLFFQWPYPLLKLGVQRELVEQDLPEILERDTSNYNRRYFEQLWQNEIQVTRLYNTRNHQPNSTVHDLAKDQRLRRHRHRQPSLHRALFRDFFRSIWYVQPLFAAAAAAKIIQAVALGRLIETFEDGVDTNTGGTNDGWTWASVIVVCGLVVLMEHHHVFFVTWRKGMQLRVACISAIYNKSLRLSSTSASTHTLTTSTTTTTTTSVSASTGQIMNLASNDVERFLLAALFTSHLIWAPLQALCILLVGWMQVGYAFGAGFALLLFGFVPFQLYLSNRFAHCRSQIASLTDKRIQLVSQAVQGARVVKMSGYEYNFLERIHQWRSKEVSQIQAASRLKAWNEATFYSANVVISMVIFLVDVWSGGTLTAGKVFTVFTLINIVQLELTKHMSLGVMGVSELAVSLTRIQRFLQLPELIPSVNAIKNDSHDRDSAHQQCQTQTDGRNKNDTSNGDVVLSMVHVDCYWNYTEDKNSTGQSNPLQSSFPTKKNVTVDKATNDATNGVGQNGKETAAVDTPFYRDNDPAIQSPSLVPALKDITIDFRCGQLTCVIGSVGSSKSALLQAIVGELPAAAGTIERRWRNDSHGGSSSSSSDDHKYNNNRIAKPCPSISYAAQDPWIMDGTIRENIVLGEVFDQRWYDQVVDAVGLRFDFSVFQFGDQTVVGDRGVQCSGGQRARISLARALYLDADIWVCDDPLSAVDNNVGKQIFYDALIGLGVARNKCVILATHQHQYVRGHRCVLLSGGSIECIGSYEDCVLDHKQFVSAESQLESQPYSKEESNCEDRNQQHTSHLTPDNANVDDIVDRNNDSVDADRWTPSGAKDDNAEKKANGVVSLDTYVAYIKAMGGFGVATSLLLTFFLTQGITLWTIATMGRWAEREDQTSWDIIGLVIGQGCTVIFLAIFRALFSFRMCIKASKNLHDTMTEAVLRAKISFFDINPIGRILNRFSADVGSNDDLLPQTLFDFTVILFIVTGAICTTVVSLPFALLAVPPLLYYFIQVRKVFVSSSRELKRLEGLARSPIFAMISESLSGIGTIRANGARNYFLSKFEDTHDAHTRCFFSFIAASRWVGFRMDLMVFLLMAIVSFLAVLFNTQGWFSIDPSILGLSISLIIQLSGMFQWCIRQSAEVSNQMVSVERVLEFADLDEEAPLNLETDKKLHSSWPDQGKMNVDKLSVRYRASLPMALNGVSFFIPGGKRVGVVGRTGSGKSSLVQSFFRLLEAEEGQIKIDSVDISTIGLHKLRTQISVIPQSPTLFSLCTVRENLDLFGLHDTAEIHQALEEAHLSDVIADLPNGIDSIVSEGGSNFSVGQRQLLCLARAILCKNRILILDEATASVDRKTDQMLQDSLSRSFRNATIIAVAHRLDTVIENDYILVLGRKDNENGKVLEFGRPIDLLQSDDGALAKMVNDTGLKTSSELRRRAFAAAAAGQTD